MHHDDDDIEEAFMRILASSRARQAAYIFFELLSRMTYNITLHYQPSTCFGLHYGHTGPLDRAR